MDLDSGLLNLEFSEVSKYGFPAPARTATCGKDFLSALDRNGIVHHADDFLELRCQAGFWVPCVNQGAAMLLGHQNPAALELVELLLDPIQGQTHVPGDRPTVGLIVMVKMKECGFRGHAAEKICQNGGLHDLVSRSCDR